jgi:hypothetical protein
LVVRCPAPNSPRTRGRAGSVNQTTPEPGCNARFTGHSRQRVEGRTAPLAWRPSKGAWVPAFLRERPGGHSRRRHDGELTRGVLIPAPPTCAYNARVAGQRRDVDAHPSFTWPATGAWKEGLDGPRSRRPGTTACGKAPAMAWRRRPLNGSRPNARLPMRERKRKAKERPGTQIAERGCRKATRLGARAPAFGLPRGIRVPSHLAGFRSARRRRVRHRRHQHTRTIRDGRKERIP